MDNELEKQAEKIRKGFVSVSEEEDEISLSFLDEINALVRIVLKDEPIDIYTLLTPEELARWKKAKVKRHIYRLWQRVSLQSVLYFSLLTTITLFLVNEAVSFYAHQDVVSSKTYLQAILTEICFIFLSGYRTDSRAQNVLVPVLRGFMFALMLFVITSEVTLEGAKDINKISNITDRIERLEKQIDATNKEIDYYKSIDWKSRMTQSISKRNELEKQVQELKERQEKEGASEEVSSLLQYKVYGKAAFRVILMMISVLITRRLWKF
jgi:Ni,Fe-hydrogenase I cytochrome b subunit